MRRLPLASQTSEESGTVVMETDMTSSTVAKKTSTVVLFTLEGMELVLTQDTKVDNHGEFMFYIVNIISSVALCAMLNKHLRKYLLQLPHFKIFCKTIEL